MVPVRRAVTVFPTKGMWTFDSAQQLPDGASPDMLNFQVYNGYIRKRPGYLPYQEGSTFPITSITGVYSAQQSTGLRALYAIDTTDVYKYNPSTTDWDVQTGGPLTGGAANLFSLDISQNNLVFCQGIDNIQALDLTGTTYADIDASAYPAKYLSRWNQRLYAGFGVEATVSKPFRVRWPVAGDHTDWTGIGSGFVDLSDDVYQIRGIRKLVDVLCVYTEKGIFLATKSGIATAPASFALQVKDVGLASPFTLLGLNTLHFFLGTDNIYVFNGVQLTPIASQVRNTIFTTLNPASLLTNFAIILYDTQEYAVFMSTTTSLACDTAWVYNWAREVMYPWKFNIAEFTCATSHYLDFSVTIGALVGTIAEQTWVLGGGTLVANAPIPVFGASDGEIHTLQEGILNDDGAAIDCKWTSKDYTAKDIDPSYGNDMITMTEVGVEFIDPGDPFTLQFYFSIDRGTSWAGPFPVTCGSGQTGAIGDAMCTRQTTGKRVRFKIENSTTDENPQVMSFTPVLELRKQKVA